MSSTKEIAVEILKLYSKLTKDLSDENKVIVIDRLGNAFEDMRDEIDSDPDDLDEDLEEANEEPLDTESDSDADDE